MRAHLSASLAGVAAKMARSVFQPSLPEHVLHLEYYINPMHMGVSKLNTRINIYPMNDFRPRSPNRPCDR